MNPAIDEIGAEEIWKEPVDRLLARPRMGSMLGGCCLYNGATPEVTKIGGRWPAIFATRTVVWI